jgi:choice-of-anchor A domain-containing protein
VRSTLPTHEAGASEVRQTTAAEISSIVLKTKLYNADETSGTADHPPGHGTLGTVIPGNTRYSPRVCAITLLFASAASATSILTPYNVIVSGNFSDGGIDCNGAAAVGGVATLGGGLNVGGDLDGEALTALPGSTTFIAAGNGGTVNGLSGTLQLAAGNYYVYGTAGTIYNNGNPKGTLDTSDPINFSSTFAQFQGTSAQISNEAQTAGDSVTGTGALTINVNQAGLNIIDLTAAQVANAGSINFVGVSSSKWVLVNVSGTTDTLNLSGGTSFNGNQEVGDGATGAEDVLYNFYQATAVQLEGAVVGSVLAPNAVVTGSGYQFDGSLVAAQFAQGTGGGTQFHNLIFAGTSFTPEPASLACVGAGLFALAALYRKRRSK